MGSTGPPAGCVVVCSEGVCGLQSPRAGEVGAGRSRGVEVRVGWLCWEHHCTRLQGRAPAQSVCRHSASERTLLEMAAIGAEGSGYTAAGRQGGREGGYVDNVSAVYAGGSLWSEDGFCCTECSVDCRHSTCAGTLSSTTHCTHKMVASLLTKLCLSPGRPESSPSSWTAEQQPLTHSHA